MARIQCRLLPYAIADGPRNMAADEVLLESATAGTASLRFYGWSQATLSLGYFQPEHSRHQVKGSEQLPYVRRPTGGATLVHHHEVTYALGLPAGGPWQTGAPWLPRMHGIIACALSHFEVATHIYAPAGKETLAGVLCFQHLSAGDILIGSAKIVGSAQRRQRGALLQHGAVLLAHSPHAPVLPGIQELSNRTLLAEEVMAAVTHETIQQTGWDLVAEDWTTGELRRIDHWVAEKYTRASWNCKR